MNWRDIHWTDRAFILFAILSSVAMVGLFVVAVMS